MIYLPEQQSLDGYDLDDLFPREIPVVICDHMEECVTHMHEVADEGWRAFAFPNQRGNAKAALYGRMWRLREDHGFDAMVRQHPTLGHVLVVRRFA